jgi:hypothetical protein
VIITRKLKDVVANFGAIHEIYLMEGTLRCTCGFEEPFAQKFDPPADADDAQDWILNEYGWGETGCCATCEAEANAEEAADRARQEYKDAIFDR